MSADSEDQQKKINVVICWHMHQPQYANRLSGIYQLPWTYLHGIKDYTDMAAHLEAEPNARAVVNFAPILLEQIDDYALQIQSFIQTGKEIGDPMLSALGAAVLPNDDDDRISLIKDCLRANKERLIDRFEPFQHLSEMAQWIINHHHVTHYLNDQFLIDLLMWYHLAWMGETIRRDDERVKQLIKKKFNYSYRERRLLVSIIGELLSELIPRYRKLAEQGRVELSMTPYAHPIVPLLLDIQSSLEAMPDATLPALEKYPGGSERVQWHIEQGKKTFQHYFGITPTGCWPSEGSVSTESMSYYDEAGFKWVASGENVLRNSLKGADIENETSVHQTFTVDNYSTACFFRDDGLSDLVGFTYSTWHADDAVANMIHHIESIADNEVYDNHPRDPVISIVLDGENAWEYYPENGYYFLSALYKELANHPRINLTTFSQCIDNNVSKRALPSLVAGSWVYGSFSTWIGDPDKNRAWDMLGEAKRCFDHKVDGQSLTDEQCQAAKIQLALCEGSDWFWWFGDYNPSDTVNDFDRLFRIQLVNLYQILGEQPPEYLSHSFAHGSGAPVQGGVMRRGSDLN